jgi:hypothetical protein
MSLLRSEEGLWSEDGPQHPGESSMSVPLKRQAKFTRRTRQTPSLCTMRASQDTLQAATIVYYVLTDDG